MSTTEIQKCLIKMSLEIKDIEDLVNGLVYWINQSDILLTGLMTSMSNLERKKSIKNIDWKDTEDT